MSAALEAKELGCCGCY